VLVAVGSDSLALGMDGLPESIFVPIRTVVRGEYRRPATRREPATRGALWGSATLGVMGFLLAVRGGEPTQLEAALYSVLSGAVWIRVEEALHHLALGSGWGERRLGGSSSASTVPWRLPRSSLPPARGGYAAQIGAIADQIGTTAEVTQGEFQVPLHWQRVRS
jgi:hypothetical protein